MVLPFAAPVFYSVKRGACSMRNLKRLSALCLTVVLCAALLAGCKSDGDGLSLSVSVGA